ncbi:hypothetical protein BGW42_007534, partial [Actinomortierella wolfii]
MTQQEIQSVASIPNTACLQLGVDALKKVSSDKSSHKFYMFTGFGGVDEDGFAALARVNDIWDHKRSLDDTITWLQDSS